MAWFPASALLNSFRRLSCWVCADYDGESSKNDFLCCCQYWVIRYLPPVHSERYLFPLVSKLFMELEQLKLFTIGPILFVDRGIEMVVPPFATLFTSSDDYAIFFVELTSNLGPVLSAGLSYYLGQLKVFLRLCRITCLVQVLRMRQI